MEVGKVKALLNEEFKMNDLGVARKIIGIEILRDQKAVILYLSQKGYIEKVFYKFNMLNAKAVNTTLVAQFKLLSNLCPQSNEHIDYIYMVFYSSAVGLLMYAMVFTNLNLVHIVGITSRYMENPSKEHW